MSELLQAARIWKLAIARLCISLLIAGGTAYTTTMSGLKWSSLDGDQKFMVILGVSVILANNVHAFLDKTISRIAEGKEAIETGTTQYFPKPRG